MTKIKPCSTPPMALPCPSLLLTKSSLASILALVVAWVLSLSHYPNQKLNCVVLVYVLFFSKSLHWCRNNRDFFGDRLTSLVSISYRNWNVSWCHDYNNDKCMILWSNKFFSAFLKYYIILIFFVKEETHPSIGHMVLGTFLLLLCFPCGIIPFCLWLDRRDCHCCGWSGRCA